MDLVISSPNPNAVMGKDSIKVDSAVAPPTGGLVTSPPLSTENVEHVLAVSTSDGRIVAQSGMTPIVPTSSLQVPVEEVKSGGVTVSPEAQQVPPQPEAATGLQIVTRRKRSSLSAAGSSNSGNPTGTATTVSASDANLAAAPAPPPGSEPGKTSQPPKKKKKYTTKPKKAAGEVEAKSEVEPKSKPPPKPKAPAKKKPSNSRSKKGQQQPQPVPTEKDVVPESSTAGNGTSVEINEVKENPAPAPPIPLAPVPMSMPKLTKMPISTAASSSSTPSHVNLPMNVYIKEEPQDWDDNLNDCDPFPIGNLLIDEAPSGGKPAAAPSSRKKKSKGRNGNIYIGVFNRIEWMKLQGEFGFQTVNNFGTFVLETMRRVHGDIQFWCDVATTSGVYPDLSHYEWQNGFPHAVNQDGHQFTPGGVEIDEEKKAELGEMARIMWEERQEFLKQQKQQQQQQQEAPVELVTVPDDVEEVEEEDVDDHPAVENYLGNIANGQYLPAGATLEGGEAQTSPAVLSHLEQLNMMWNKETSNPNNLQAFGELFNYVNGIQQSGTQGEVTGEDGMEESVEISFEADGSASHLPDVIIEEIQEGEGERYEAMQV